MKRAIIAFSLFIYVIVWSGCKINDYEMYTRIYPDGSCTREFLQITDSAFYAGDTSSNPFPMKLDSSWQLSRFRKISGDSNRGGHLKSIEPTVQKDLSYYYLAVASRKFSSIEDLAATFRYDNDAHWDSVSTVIKFSRKFYWLYTYYEFSETYPKVNPFKLVPINKYLSKEEAETWFGESAELYKGLNGEEVRDLLDNIEKKVNEWLERSYYEEIFLIYCSHYNEFSNMPVDEHRFAQAKDSIFRFLRDSLNRDPKMQSYFNDNFSKGLDLYLHTNAFSRNTSEQFEQQVLDEMPDLTKYFGTELKYKLTMPGKVFETNAPFIKGDTLTWKIDANRFFVNDYTILAMSRKLNNWAVIFTSGLILLAIAWVFKRRKHKRNG